MSSNTADNAAAAVNTISAGDFASLPNISVLDMNMLKDAYNAVTASGAWDAIANFTGESFMFSSEPWLNDVQKHMKLMDQHSGASYGCTMRIIEKIARDGWDAYVADYIAYFKKKEADAAARARADTEEAALDARRMERRA